MIFSNRFISIFTLSAIAGVTLGACSPTVKLKPTLIDAVAFEKCSGLHQVTVVDEAPVCKGNAVITPLKGKSEYTHKVAMAAEGQEMTFAVTVVATDVDVPNTATKGNIVIEVHAIGPIVTAFTPDVQVTE